MAPGGETAQRQKTAAGDGEDRISALHEDILHHILSFLDSRVVVQTCVLARSWRNRWKSVPALRVTEEHAFENAHAMNKFVNYLVILRGMKPLVECEIHFWHAVRTSGYLDMWIRYALLCEVRVLRVTSSIVDDISRLPSMDLVSNKLTKVELCCVESIEPLLDFSSCSALQELKLSDSIVEVAKILSPSVKTLSICRCNFLEDAPRARISAPSLTFVQLVDCMGKIPFFDSMPSLVSASVKTSCDDWCKNGFEIGGCADASCQGCVGSKGLGKGSVLLESMKHALHLELKSRGTTHMFIFRRDLTLGPLFTKLKTLVVDEWCIVANLHSLISFIQHSPVIEKLTLQLLGVDEDIVVNEAKYDQPEQSSAFQHLTVEVQCFKFFERIKKKMQILTACGVPPKQIKIRQFPQNNVRSFASLLNDEMVGVGR